MAREPVDEQEPANENIGNFPAAFCGKLPIKYIIENAMKREDQLAECIIIGRFKDTGQLYITTTTDDTTLINWLIDRVKFALMNGDLPDLPYEPPA